jgi:hypothetical protein
MIHNLHYYYYYYYYYLLQLGFHRVAVVLTGHNRNVESDASLEGVGR